MLRLWVIVSAIAIGLLLGAAPLFDADEGRNAEVAREMAATNDYVLPHLDGLPYLDKPIVYFAAEAAFMEVLGPTELAARLPAYLFTLATAAVVFWFARRLWGVDDGSVAAIAFLSMPLVIAFARTVIFDSALAFFMAVAIVAFYFAVETDERKWSVIAWASMGFGVITKGPVALAVPLIVVIPYAIWRKRFRRLWTWPGLALFVAAIAPWVIAIERSVPGFLRYVLVTETAQRLTTGALKRTGPPWYFIPFLIGGALPWSIAAIEALRPRAPHSRDALRARGLSPRFAGREVLVFLWLWVLVPLVFFSLSQSKRPQYILPVMPAVALLAARQLRLRAAAIVTAVSGAILAAAPLFVKKIDPAFAAAAKQSAYILGALLLAGGIAAAVAKRRDIAVIALSIPMLAIPVVTAPVMRGIGERRSTKSLMAKVAPYAAPRVIGIESFTGSMTFYLHKPVTVVSDDGEEFTSNYVIRHYAAFAGAPSSPLQPTAWLRSLPDGLYIVREKDHAHRALFESRGVMPVASDAHYVAYRMKRSP